MTCSWFLGYECGRGAAAVLFRCGVEFHSSPEQNLSQTIGNSQDYEGMVAVGGGGRENYVPCSVKCRCNVQVRVRVRGRVRVRVRMAKVMEGRLLEHRYGVNVYQFVWMHMF